MRSNSSIIIILTMLFLASCSSDDIVNLLEGDYEDGYSECRPWEQYEIDDVATCASERVADISLGPDSHLYADSKGIEHAFTIIELLLI